MMRRNVLAVMMCMVALFVACGSNTARNDGRAVSERIINTVAVDSAFVASNIMALDSIVTPVVFGRDFAMVVVDAIERDSIKSGADLYNRIVMLRDALVKKKGERGYCEFREGIQSYIDRLPMKRQMTIYAKVSTPQQLGTALRIDRSSNKSDSAKIDMQVNELMSIYDEAEKALFLKYYNLK